MDTRLAVEPLLLGRSTFKKQIDQHKAAKAKTCPSLLAFAFNVAIMRPSKPVVQSLNLEFTSGPAEGLANYGASAILPIPVFVARAVARFISFVAYDARRSCLGVWFIMWLSKQYSRLVWGIVLFHQHLFASRPLCSYFLMRAGNVVHCVVYHQHVLEYRSVDLSVSLPNHLQLFLVHHRILAIVQRSVSVRYPPDL